MKILRNIILFILHQLFLNIKNYYLNGNQSQEFDNTKQSGLFIRTDKRFYFSGEQVQGNFVTFLSVEGNSFPSLTIYLKVKGSEKAKSSGKEQQQVTDHYDNKNEFFQHRI